MLGIRVNPFNEAAIGETEQDANSALTELDKGLRSTKVGDQCEAIVRFPRLFEKYPFPILINASFLKLALVFRTGNNFLRLCVLRVCQQSDKHLDKVSNVDEFVRRIYGVIHSNDPIARALTLRTLGAVACIIPERQQVHHSIRTSLDSHDYVEVEAAIYIATQFAAQSRTFAISMCNKIADMIQGQATPANMKLQLIPILQHMHHDTNTAAMVRQLCADLLPKYPTEEFILVTLHTLTQLAAATLVDIPAQVSLLLHYIKNDSRKMVKGKCVKHLHMLAKPGAHLWPNGAIDSFLDIALNTKSPKLLYATMQVIQVLVESPQMCHNHHHVQSKLRVLCATSCFSPHPPIVAQALQILTQIICYCHTERIKITGTEDIISSLETMILLLTFSDEKYPYQLKMTLRCIVRLSEVDKQYCEKFVNLLGSRLGRVDNDRAIVICEALGAIGGTKPEALILLLPDILNHLSVQSDSSEQQTKIVVLLCTLVFQTLSSYAWTPEATSIILRAATVNDGWAAYRIGRAAMRYGHHYIANRIFDVLTEQVSYEHWHFWLVCLAEMSSAEAMLTNKENVHLVDRLDYAIVHYNKAIAALKAASTPAHHLQFQAAYMHIRCEFLQCVLLLIHTCNILCTVPPPAIASTIAQAARDDLQRHGYITNQMRKCVKEFKTCGELCFKLYQTAFDADDATLENLQILQHICTLLEQCAESVCNANSSAKQVIEFDDKNCKLESRQLLIGCRNAARICRNIADGNLGLTITHKHVDLLKSMGDVFVNASLPVPRFFFQVLQNTVLKLAISPQPRVLGEFISVQAGSQLAVKIEGIIQHGSKTGLFRNVDGVLISVQTQLQPSSKSKETDPKVETSYVLKQTVTPHKDFFSAQFLLAFPLGGLFVLTIEVSVVDEHGNVWNTGPKSTLSVKVPEETKLQPITMPGMAVNANMILMTEDSLFIRKK